MKRNVILVSPFSGPDDGGANGVNDPESTDECLNTIINGLSAANRVNPRNCTPRSSPIQIGDFSPSFRSGALKLVVMITDHGPDGFCDEDRTYDYTQAGIYAQQARNQCIHINAIQVNNNGDATTAMLNYFHETCGWYEQTDSAGTGLAQYINRMLYVPGDCNCP